MATVDAAEAARREQSFLGNLANAQDDYEWIVANEAWTGLGHDSFAAWWRVRVVPVMRALSMRPTREIAAAGIEQVRREDVERPPAQRHTQREIGEMFGVTQQAIASRFAPDKNLSPADLDETPMPARQDVADAIVADIDQRVQVEADARRDGELDAALEGTDVRFRRNFSTAMRRAAEIWSFDADRIAEVYAADFAADIERTFIREMTAFCDRVTEAHRRRQRAGLRVISGGTA